MSAATPTVSAQQIVGDDHPVYRRLRIGITPFLLLAEDLRKTPLYRTHKIYSWTRDVLAAAAGTGLVPPVFDQINKAMANNPESNAALAGAVSKLPVLSLSGGVIALLALAALKLILSRYDADKRTVLTDSCYKEFKAFSNRLTEVLQQPDPEPDLTKIQNKIADSVERLISEDSWPFTPPYTHIRSRADDLANRFRDTYGASWTNVPDRRA